MPTRRLFVFAILILCLFGCATESNIYTRLYYTSKIPQLHQTTSKVPIRLAAVEDARASNNPHFLTHFVYANFYDKSSAMALSRRSVADVTYDALHSNLLSAGYNISAHGKYVLRGKILSLKFNWQAGDIVSLNGDLIVQFSLLKKRSGKLVWTETYHGDAVRVLSLPWSGSPSDDQKYQAKSYAILFNAALNNLLISFINSDEFKHTLERIDA